jgi:S-(hydroxymethyl)glutathione dehydrogenase/alcohol dehydrogenase
VVFGTGGIGLNAIMAASMSGAVPVIGVDPNPARRDLALAYGATYVIDPTTTDPVAEVRKLVPNGADAAVEATGLPAVMDQAMKAVRQQGGRAVVIGNAKAGSTLSLDPAQFNQGKSLLGTWGGDAVPDRDYARFARLLAASRFDTRALLSAPYRLDQATQALDDLAAGKVGRPLIDMALV